MALRTERSKEMNVSLSSIFLPKADFYMILHFNIVHMDKETTEDNTIEKRGGAVLDSCHPRAKC